jgi:hypothetical protein
MLVGRLQFSSIELLVAEHGLLKYIVWCLLGVSYCLF